MYHSEKDVANLTTSIKNLNCHRSSIFTEKISKALFFIDSSLGFLQFNIHSRTINQAVKRNLERFPERNCFQLTRDELPDSLKSQIVILNESGNKRGFNVKKLPNVLAEIVREIGENITH